MVTHRCSPLHPGSLHLAPVHLQALLQHLWPLHCQHQLLRWTCLQLNWSCQLDLRLQKKRRRGRRMMKRLLMSRRRWSLEGV